LSSAGKIKITNAQDPRGAKNAAPRLDIDSIRSITHMKYRLVQPARKRPRTHFFKRGRIHRVTVFKSLYSCHCARIQVDRADLQSCMQVVIIESNEANRLNRTGP